MRVFLFIDLDDTLFQTHRKCMGEEDLTPIGFDRSGNALSFMTRRQRGMFNWLSEATTLIPTTARNADAFRRVRLEWKGPAVINYGAVILNTKGVADAAWDACVRPLVEPMREELHDILRDLEEYALAQGKRVRARVISDHGMSLYIVVKNVNPEVNNLGCIANWMTNRALQDRFAIHLNDNNLSLVPTVIDKSKAMHYLVENCLRTPEEEILVLGMGDSLSDLRYMCNADYCIVPRNSQIMNVMMQVPSV